MGDIKDKAEETSRREKFKATHIRIQQPWDGEWPELMLEQRRRMKLAIKLMPYASKLWEFRAKFGSNKKRSMVELAYDLADEMIAHGGEVPQW